MTIFAACGKDEDTSDNGGGNNPVEAAANTLVMNDHTYQLECGYEIAADGRSYADATTVEQDVNHESLYTVIADVEVNTLNKTYDIINPVEGEIFYFNIHDANYDLSIDPGLFTSGTLTISRDENLFVYKVSGVIEGGKPVSFNISVPAAEWEQLEW